MSNLSIIHDIDSTNAPLPQVYEKAVAAIVDCNNIDECKDWGDKAKALASYARQADDDELENYCKRIRARAIRRCGELMNEFDGRGGDRKSENFKKDTSVPFETKAEFGKQAGMSERQIKTASTVARIPEDQFNTMVDNEKPATIKELTEHQKIAVEILEKPKPEGYAETIQLIGYTEELLKRINDHPPEYFLNAMEDRHIKEASGLMKKLGDWIAEFNKCITEL